MTQHLPEIPDTAVEVVPEVAAVRSVAREVSAAQARQLRAVADLAAWVEREARSRLALSPRVPGQPSDEEVVASAVTGEVMTALGLSRMQTVGLVELARRLTRVLPRALDELEAGHLDLSRARVLSEATSVLDGDGARRVSDRVLGATGAAGPDRAARTGEPGPWDGPSPRTWRARVARAVVAEDLDAARRRHQLAVAARAVRVWSESDGVGVLQVRAAAEDVAMADRVITGLAESWPVTAPDGAPLGMDQHRTDALMDLLRRVHTGRPLPTTTGPDAPSGAPATAGAPASAGSDATAAGAPAYAGADASSDASGAAATAGGKPTYAGTPVGRGREIGLVLHVDTLFGDGPQARVPGELRGLGEPVPLDPSTARETTVRAVAAGTTVRALVVDGSGALVATAPLGHPPVGGWTRPAVGAAARAAVQRLPELCTAAYEPTVATAEHVRARNPQCTGYDCPRSARRCDLDHDEPWPRGPTAATNLHPRCRRDHELKTRGVVTTRLHPDGSVTTHMLTGLLVTTRPDPLPGTARTR
jgi:hypothetical protein